MEILRRLHAEDRVAVRAVGKLLPALAKLAEHTAWALSRGGRLLYVGAGTSGRLGALDAAECPPTFGTAPGQVRAIVAGGPAALTHAVEGAEDNRVAGAKALRDLALTGNDVVVAITASARTPFVLGALGAARAAGATTVLLTANPLARGETLADQVLVMATGPELIAGSTRLKAGTATKLVLNGLSTASMVLLGRVIDGWMVGLKPTNQKLRRRAERMVAQLMGEELPQAARRLARAGGRPSAVIPKGK